MGEISQLGVVYSFWRRKVHLPKLSLVVLINFACGYERVIQCSSIYHLHGGLSVKEVALCVEVSRVGEL